MIKNIVAAAAVSGLALTTALAQSPSPTTPPASPPPPSATAPSTSAPATMPSTPATKSDSAKFLAKQAPDQMLASKFKGTDVIGADDAKIGDVSDILFDKDAKIEAYVISVGGFLGIGSKDVAMAPSEFQVVAGDKSKNESDKLKVAMTKDELKQAANFEPYRAPSSTTGMGGPASSSRPAPAGGGMAR